MSTFLLIKGGLIIDPSRAHEVSADIRIVDGVITEISPSLSPHDPEPVLDASGLWIAPGFIDLHTHLRDFAQSDQETIESGTAAAACGGYTTVVAMANTQPPVDSTAVLSELIRRIEEHARVEVLPVACVTRRMEGAELTNMVELARAGAVAFSDDGQPIGNLSVLQRALKYAKLADRVIVSHAENKHLSGQGVIHEGLVSTTLGLPGLPAAAESAAVAAEIEVARQVEGRLHFAHISCAASVELIRRARAQGLAVTADVTPHHLALGVEDIKTYDSRFKMNPPLRTAADRAALIEGLKDGTLDAIATDHAPHTRQDKSRPMDEAPFGVIGLETAFAVTCDLLVRQHKMSPLEFVSLFTIRAARVLGLPEPAVRSQQRATLTVVDPDKRWTYDAYAGQSRSHNSPFAGLQLIGKNLLTVYEGNTVYTDPSLVAPRMKSPSAAGQSGSQTQR